MGSRALAPESIKLSLLFGSIQYKLILIVVTKVISNLTGPKK